MQKKYEQYRIEEHSQDVDICIVELNDVLSIHKALKEHAKKRTTQSLAGVLHAVRKAKRVADQDLPGYADVVMHLVDGHRTRVRGCDEGDVA